MNCPKCGHKMQKMWEEILRGTIETVGHCNNCDYDGKWKIEVLPDGKIKEYDLQRLYFG
jgi:hypothetical protein